VNYRRYFANLITVATRLVEINCSETFYKVWLKSTDLTQKKMKLLHLPQGSN
jgi:hypothetical protein